MIEASRYVFEFDGDPAGILVRDPEGYVFNAAAAWAGSLDGSHFASLSEAEHAIHAASRVRRGSIAA